MEARARHPPGGGSLSAATWLVSFFPSLKISHSSDTSSSFSGLSSAYSISKEMGLPGVAAAGSTHARESFNTVPCDSL